MKKNLITTLLFITLIAGVLIQKSLLEPHRGQAMGMPFITSYIVFFVLMVVYAISFFCHRFVSGFVPIYFAIAAQLLLMGFTIHQFIFYQNLQAGNIPIDDWDSDYFPPIDLNFYIIAFFSFGILGFCFWVLKIKKIQ